MFLDFAAEQIRNLAIVAAFGLTIAALLRLALRIGDRNRRRVFDDQDGVRDFDHEREG